MLRMLYAGVIAAFIFVLSEWLFQVTKPSFFATANPAEKLFVPLFTFSLLSFLVVMVEVALYLSGRMLPSINGLLVIPGVLLPSFILACTALLLVDNFTYTVLQWGISTAHGFIRVIYMAAFVAMLVIIYQRIRKWVLRKGRPAPQKPLSILHFASGSLLLAVATLLVARITWNAPLSGMQPGGTVTSPPDIYLVTADGLNADNMSVYGYERATTPFLESISSRSLVALNHFTNSGSTTGSILSLLTSKTPFTTRALLWPDVLLGEDAYQHIAGILQSKGYYTAQMTVSEFGDAYSLNVKDGFNEANGASENRSIVLKKIRAYLPDHYALFIHETFNRLADRLRHVFFIKEMVNPMDQVATESTRTRDEEILPRIKELLDNTRQPLFVQVHWMGTHGPAFHPVTQVFSAGQSEQEQSAWSEDFYDDAILEFDRFIQALYNETESKGRAGNTVFIITSDHGQQWVTDSRLPLLIIFPGSRHASRIDAPTQNIDIPPTVLHYLGLPVPGWMEGTSLLDPLPPDRQIISARTLASTEETQSSAATRVPPFYQFGSISAVYCGNLYTIDLSTGARSITDVAGYQGGCPEGRQPEIWIFDQLLAYLTQRGSDTASLAVP